MRAQDTNVRTFKDMKATVIFEIAISAKDFRDEVQHEN